MNGTTFEQQRLLRAISIAGVASILSLILLTAATGTRKELVYSVQLELGAVLAALLIVGARAAQRWTKRHDLLSPLVALPIAYVAWFALGSIDWIEVPSTWLFGFFDPIPGRMWIYYAPGLAGFVGGALLIRAPRTQTGGIIKLWDLRRARITLTVLFASMLVAWLVLIVQFGIPGNSANASEARLAVRGPFYLLFVCSAWTLFLFLPIAGWQKERGKRQRFFTFGLLAVTALLLSSLAGRSNIFVPLLTLLIARHFAIKRFDLKLAIGVTLAAFLGLSLFGYLRDTAESDRSLLWMQTAGIPQPLVPAATAAVYVRYSIATFRDVTEMIPAHGPYQHGALTLAPFKTFLPGRQEMSDIFFRNLLGNDFIGAGEPATLLGPLYGDFGIPGILLGMFGFGLALSYLYKRMRSRPDPFRILLYAWVLQSGLFGLFATIFPYITTLMLPALWYGLHRYLRVGTETVAE